MVGFEQGARTAYPGESCAGGCGRSTAGAPPAAGRSERETPRRGRPGTGTHRACLCPPEGLALHRDGSLSPVPSPARITQGRGCTRGALSSTHRPRSAQVSVPRHWGQRPIRMQSAGHQSERKGRMGGSPRRQRRGHVVNLEFPADPTATDCEHGKLKIRDVTPCEGPRPIPHGACLVHACSRKHVLVRPLPVLASGSR